MKIRFGFVSNSSSSSFVCNICGRTESGWDAGAEDFDMVECIHGHVVCIDEANIPDELTLEEIKDGDEYYIREEYCPICNFEVLSRSDAKKYLQKKYSITDDEVFVKVKEKNKRRKKLYDQEYVFYVLEKFDIQESKLLEEIKNKFKTYSDFYNYVRI